MESNQPSICYKANALAVELWEHLDCLMQLEPQGRLELPTLCLQGSCSTVGATVAGTDKLAPEPGLEPGIPWLTAKCLAN